MNQLYQRSKIWFAVSWIIVYVIGTSMADLVSGVIGIEKSITLPFLLLLTLLAVFWLGKNGLFSYYGLRKPCVRPKAMLFYLPLAVIASCNFWFGVTVNMSVLETVLSVFSMLLVGFLEELIFRGFLFQAMRKDSEKAAVIVSSLTFGAGHLVNLFNGSGAELLPNLLQVCYAVAAGFLFVIIFCRTQSLLPCVFTHSVLNALSVFAVQQNIAQEIFTAVILCILPILYSVFLLKSCPRPESQEDGSAL